LLHAWYGEHHSPLGSCPDYKIIDALTPKKADLDKPSQSRDEYEIPTRDKNGNLVPARDTSITSKVALVDLCDD
jgi:hypothetical protein